MKKITAKDQAHEQKKEAFTAESAYGIMKTFHDEKRAERYELKQQLKLLSAQVAGQLREELASAVKFSREEGIKATLNFKLTNRFKQNWHNAKSQIRNTHTGKRISVFEAEIFAFRKYLKKLNVDFEVVCNKELQTMTFIEKIVGMDPGEKLWKIEQDFIGLLEECQNSVK